MKELILIAGFVMAGFASASVPQVWVWKGDGQVSCDAAPGRALERDERALKTAKVKVFRAEKTHDGKLRAMMCGMPTGSQNSFLISPRDLAKAKRLGFNVKAD